MNLKTLLLLLTCETALSHPAEIRFPNNPERISRLTTRPPGWGHPIVAPGVKAPEVKFPISDTVPTVKIVENYSVTNVVYHQDDKSNSLIELLNYLHELPPNETLSAVNEKMSTTTESVIEVLNKLRQEKPSSSSSTTVVTTTTEAAFTTTVATTTTTVATTTTTVATTTDFETTLSSFVETTESFPSASDDVTETSAAEVTTQDSSITKTISETEMAPSVDDDTVIQSDQTEIIASSNVIELTTLRTVDSSDAIELAEVNGESDNVVEQGSIATNSGERDFDTKLTQDSVEITTTQGQDTTFDLILEDTTKSEATQQGVANSDSIANDTSETDTALYHEGLSSKACSNGSDDGVQSNCADDSPVNVVLIAGVTVGIVIVLVTAIVVLSFCFCKRSHHRKNVYATMEEEQPKDFTKVGPPVILQDELLDSNKPRLYTRNSDKVTEL